MTLSSLKHHSALIPLFVIMGAGMAMVVAFSVRSITKTYDVSWKKEEDPYQVILNTAFCLPRFRSNVSSNNSSSKITLSAMFCHLETMSIRVQLCSPTCIRVKRSTKAHTKITRIIEASVCSISLHCQTLFFF